jgi:hypothetical protein
MILNYSVSGVVLQEQDHDMSLLDKDSDTGPMDSVRDREEEE